MQRPVDSMDFSKAGGADLELRDQPQTKRKGGRKLIYSTAEERKLRNRQSQTAFRERRTEYIKELEERVTAQNANLQRAQAAESQATDECLMLRYKNSLLERILLEKGVDVRAELYEKEKGSNGDPVTFVANSVPLPIEPSNLHNPLSNSNRSLPRLDPSTARSNVPSPPSLVNSPQNYMVENNPTADPIRTPSSISTSEFEPVRPSCVSPQLFETQRQADAPQPNTASESIVKLLKQSKTGGMRDAAAFYLTSFLKHIETLENEAETSNLNHDATIHRETSASNQQLFSPQTHGSLDCHIKDGPFATEIRNIPNKEVTSCQPMSQLLRPYHQMQYHDPFGLDDSMQFSANFNF